MFLIGQWHIETFGGCWCSPFMKGLMGRGNALKLRALSLRCDGLIHRRIWD